MKKGKAILSSVLASAMLLGLTACGGDSGSSSASSAASGSATAESTAGAESAAASLGTDTQAIVDRGVLRVGVKNAVVGFGYQDPATGEYSGCEFTGRMRNGG